MVSTADHDCNFCVVVTTLVSYVLRHYHKGQQMVYGQCTIQFNAMHHCYYHSSFVRKYHSITLYTSQMITASMPDMVGITIVSL